MNIGAGRIVMQSLSYIQKLIDDGEFYRNPVLDGVFEQAEGHAIHLLVLVSRGGVHSNQDHLYALLELARKRRARQVYVHAFTDGRDTPPDSAQAYIAELQEKIAGEGVARIASVSGRYYAMYRDHRWQRTRRAFDALVCGSSEWQADSGVEAVRQAYQRGETDEFIQPTVITADGKAIGPIRDGDGVIFFNFRADRARQLSYALLGDSGWHEFERCRPPAIHFASLMQYDQDLAAPFAFELPAIAKCLAEVISKTGLRQYHTAETEKYAHVTYFFNARRESPFPGETRKLIPSPKVATYDLKPEMSAPELTRATLERIRGGDDDFILVNYANPDMVGHTGVLKAAVRACEAADKGLGQLVEAVRSRGGITMIIADHGNAEMMIDEDGGPHTAHTTNPVPCVLVGAAAPTRLRSGGVLGDVAPTLLALLGVPQPEEMTGHSLIQNQGRP